MSAVDGWLTNEFLKYGRPAEILRNAIDFPDLGNKNFHLLVKAPGSDRHRFPAAMRDLGQEIADHQYSVSPAARQKACILTYRKTKISYDKKLLADVWHAHALPKEKINIFRTFVFAHALFTQGFLRPSIFRLNHALAMNEYLLSDIEPSFIQSSTATKDLMVRQIGTGLESRNPDSIPQMRAPERSLLFITSQVFHRAPTAEDFAPENLGKDRRFLDILYMPTNAAKKLIPAIK